MNPYQDFEGEMDREAEAILKRVCQKIREMKMFDVDDKAVDCLHHHLGGLADISHGFRKKIAALEHGLQRIQSDDANGVPVIGLLCVELERLLMHLQGAQLAMMELDPALWEFVDEHSVDEDDEEDGDEAAPG